MGSSLESPHYSQQAPRFFSVLGEQIAASVNVNMMVDIDFWETEFQLASTISMKKWGATLVTKAESAIRSIERFWDGSIGPSEGLLD